MLLLEILLGLHIGVCQTHPVLVFGVTENSDSEVDDATAFLKKSLGVILSSPLKVGVGQLSHVQFIFYLSHLDLLLYTDGLVPVILKFVRFYNIK